MSDIILYNITYEVNGKFYTTKVDYDHSSLCDISMDDLVELPCHATKVRNAEENITRIVKKYKRQNGGSGGETAIYKVLYALIDAGLAGSDVCIGSLDPTWSEDLQLVINDEDALRRLGRMIWWGEGI